MRSDLSGVPDSELEPKRHSRGVFSRSKKWLHCCYEVRATVGPADLVFELWYQGKKFSQNHAPIRVVWDEEGAAVSAPPGPGTASAGGSSPAGSVSGLSSEARSEAR